jgi:biopolymer transport protein ExbD
MRLPNEPDVPAQINILPMIDVVFAILTFFILSSLFLSRTEGLPVNLPKAETAKPQSQNSTVVVTVNRQGQLSLNRKPITLAQLEPALDSLATATALMVVINADAKVEHGLVIAVMDRVRKVPGAKLAIATQRPK